MRFPKFYHLSGVLLTSLILLLITGCQPEGKHLFILSGQSNMANLNVKKFFLPTVVEAFGAENVIMVKDAKGGAPIRQWYRDWQPPAGSEVVADPFLYDSLMNKVIPAIAGKKIETITFLWMQGERDARLGFGEVYEESLRGLYDQLSKNLDRQDINFVIGRLSDFSMNNVKYQHWMTVREAQMAVAASSSRFTWVDTDDLNDGINIQGKESQNDLHMSKKGYPIMGRRFAEEAIKLIKTN
ncbi:MAG: sialate O-acetylesterase [Lewinella sp.]